MNDFALTGIRFVFPLLAFLTGSIPFALWIVRWRAGLDIREHGSGNPGASNVIRVVGPAIGVPVLLLDIAKGALPVWLATLLSSGMSAELATWYQIIIGLLAGAGHILSPFMNWKGGKGVATFAGVFFVLFPAGMLTAMLIALISIAVFRYFSLGSIIGVLSLPISYFIFLDEPFSGENLPLLAILVLTALLIVLRHTDNLKRLIRGEELSIVDKQKAAGDE